MTEEKNRISELIYDEKFIQWVLHPDRSSNLYWENFIKENPARKSEIHEAKFIIKSLNKKERGLDDTSVKDMWDIIHRKRVLLHRKTSPFARWAVAASVLVLIGTAAGIFYQQHAKDKTIDYRLIAKIEPQGNEVRLILSDKSEKSFSSDDPTFKYNKSGEIEVDTIKLVAGQNKVKKADQESLNQLVVPMGKRSSLTLSDGTKLWLNSGSRVIYPVAFGKKEREIFIEGEAYLDVAHNPEKPFYVVTNHMKVRVLGTEFNVNAYPDEVSTNIVLVKGNIQAEIESRKIPMQENQLLTFKNSSKETLLKKINVLEYVSWRDGWMYCNNEKLGSVASKLGRYYNKSIRFDNQSVMDLTISGKLDLKSKCEEVFDVISFIAPVDFVWKDEEIRVFAKPSIN